jgi:hypothetical protein
LRGGIGRCALRQLEHGGNHLKVVARPVRQFAHQCAWPCSASSGARRLSLCKLDRAIEQLNKFDDRDAVDGKQHQIGRVAPHPREQAQLGRKGEAQTKTAITKGKAWTAEDVLKVLRCRGLKLTP